MSEPGQKTFKYTTHKLKQKKNDIYIFKKVYVKVKANKFSSFSLNLTPNHVFREIVASEAELI